jgi:hypothetical protein
MSKCAEKAFKPIRFLAGVQRALRFRKIRGVS